jgi:hypothetical protein
MIVRVNKLAENECYQTQFEIILPLLKLHLPINDQKKEKHIPKCRENHNGQNK